MVQKRDIVISILLSLVTCGLYSIYWIITMTDDAKILTQDSRLKSGGMTYLLIIITCGIYGFFWAYNLGKALSDYKRKLGKASEDHGVLYLILYLLAFSIVVVALAQSVINEEVQTLAGPTPTN